MSRPLTSNAEQKDLLSQFAQKYVNDQDEFVAEDILPRFSVAEKTGNFAKYDVGNTRVYLDQLYTAPGTRAHDVDYSVSKGEFRTRKRALEKRIPDEDRENFDDPFDPEEDAVALIQDVMLTNQELSLANAVTDTSTFTQNITLSGTDQFDDYANSDPFKVIQDGINTIRDATGAIANSIFLQYDVMVKLKRHPDVREQVKYTGGGGHLSNEAFVQFLGDEFGLDNVYVGTATYNSNQEGQSTNKTDVWNKDILLFHQTESPTTQRATLGYTFVFEEEQIEMYREESHESDVVRMKKNYDQNLMNTDLAYLIKDAVS